MPGIQSGSQGASGGGGQGAAWFGVVKGRETLEQSLKAVKMLAMIQEKVILARTWTSSM